MNANAPAYGLWMLVVLSSLVFIAFLYSFAMPQSRRDWRSLGALSAFIVALFTEMYGFPLTLYLFSSARYRKCRSVMGTEIQPGDRSP